MIGNISPEIVRSQLARRIPLCRSSQRRNVALARARVPSLRAPGYRNGVHDLDEFADGAPIGAGPQTAGRSVRLVASILAEQS